MSKTVVFVRSKDIKVVKKAEPVETPECPTPKVWYRRLWNFITKRNNANNVATK